MDVSAEPEYEWVRLMEGMEDMVGTGDPGAMGSSHSGGGTGREDGSIRFHKGLRTLAWIYRRASLAGLTVVNEPKV
ncbi:hypothetical protein PUNSTDRAFT_49911 [Punctularia strigosozonata HHB-11173 SS5]|uniref:uncharacterized protein n=1 Tax=Punctularia strigosozonata (strain HHB-11173) TaxID=741275 RepID=UPI00044175A4|nr:uncharacterized protein PUNSTDRAFT_49911 [Punctularia strigosozonata HHB-11173 SS5]EIN12615.1 hypothetical protein PUNSTDRAFT_49911 [Punctularia strigosozonata HHB-11173 SS5]